MIHDAPSPTQPDTSQGRVPLRHKILSGGRSGKSPIRVFLEGIGSAIRLSPKQYEVKRRDSTPPMFTAARKLAYRGQKIRTQIN